MAEIPRSAVEIAAGSITTRKSRLRYGLPWLQGMTGYVNVALKIRIQAGSKAMGTWRFVGLTNLQLGL